MAVLTMQKVQVIVHQPQVDAFLQCVQKHGALEFTESAINELPAVTATAPHAALLPRVQHAVQFLVPYQTKPGLLTILRTGTTTDYSEQEITERLKNASIVESIVIDVEALQVQLAEKTATVQQLSEQQRLLTRWKEVPNTLADLDTKLTTSTLVSTTADDARDLSTVIATTLESHPGTAAVDVYGSVALVTVSRSHQEVVAAELTAAGLDTIERPVGTETPAVELVAVEEALAAAKGELGVVHDQAEHVAHTHLKQLHTTQEILEWEQARYAVLADARQTASTAVLTGWLVADSRADIEAEITEQEIVAVLSDLEPAAGEEPPVEIKNSNLIKPFEAVTRLYGMPGYKDLDPTLFLAGFFFLFFGLSLTDVGYGLTLVVISGGLLAFAKLKAGVRAMMKLLLFIGIATVLVGALFGGYFGIAPELLPAPLQALQMFDPIGNPLPVFYLALSLGVFQVMVGLVLRIYSEARNGALVDGLWSQGPWLLLFTVGIVYVLAQVGYVDVSTVMITQLVYVGLGLLVIGAVRQSSGVLEAIMNVGGTLYGSVGFLSDILSYSRLLALGLATTALAFAVNLIAGIVYGDGGVVGAVLAGIILIIGHVFTLAVNTLGAFIHSARLQFVEFFGKFVLGTGRSFAPLTRTENHITVTKE